MKNKVLAVLLMGIMAVSMVACGSKSGTLDTSAYRSEITDVTDIADEAVATGTIQDEESTEEPSVAPEEMTIDFIKSTGEDIVADIDIQGCDTFTQIVDKKLQSGMGYANTKIGDTDVILVTSGTYDNLDGNMAAIDAVIYRYDENGSVVKVGDVVCGGTAYPLAVKNNMLIAGSNTWICKYTIKNGELVITEMAAVDYSKTDADGNETYYADSEDNKDFQGLTSKEAQKVYDDMYADLETAEVINFSTVE